MLGYLLGGLVLGIGVVLGAAAVMVMHHIELHARLTENRERETLVVRPAPRHAHETPEITKISPQYSGQQPAQGATPSRINNRTEEIPQPVRTTRVASRDSSQEDKKLQDTVPTRIPVEVDYQNPTVGMGSGSKGGN